jgi:nucleoid-associated protein YgaU
MTFSSDHKNADFSDVSGGSTSSNSPGTGKADFSDVTAGSSSTAATSGRNYIVKTGDNLSKIAKQFYGDPAKWKKIHAANADKIPNPDLIHPGLQLTIPDA